MSIPKSGNSRTPRPSPGFLSEPHRRMLEEESGISADVVAESGVRTITRGRELPREFSWRQRERAPGMLFKVHRPNGQTCHSFRPDEPDPENPGHKYEQPPKCYGGPGNVLYIHPSQRHLIDDRQAPVIFVEGIKKALAIVSAARAVRADILVVGILGVWNWLSEHEPIPDMYDVSVEGRRVSITFDSDKLRNWKIQDAERRLAEHLEGRGAEVWSTFLPDKPDGKKMGADDFLAGGGTLEELEALARPYDPEDLAEMRLSRDEELRRAIDCLQAELEAMPARKMADCSNRAAMRDLVKTAKLAGELEQVEDGVLAIRVPRSARKGAVGAQLSLGGWKKSIDRLEAAGRLRRAMWGREKDKPGAYVLLIPHGGGCALREQVGEGATHGESQHGREQKATPPLQTSHRGVHAPRAPSEEVPELRWPKVIHTWAWREGRRVVVDSFYVARLGKRRGEIIRYVVEHDGAEEHELLERFGSKSALKRPREFRRRMLGPIEAEGIITLQAGRVEPTPAWREALEAVRERDGEIEDARLQVAKFAREEEAFRQARTDGRPADPTPELKGREHMRRIIEHHRPRWAREEEEKRRCMVEPAKEFVSGILGGQKHIRLGLLEEMWRERGGQHWHLRLALRELRCTIKRHPEHPSELFVYWRTSAQAEEDPAPTEEEMRARREPGPENRREAIRQAIARLFAERPEYRSRRVGQITCALVNYIGPDFPHGADGFPKDHEVEKILEDLAA